MAVAYGKPLISYNATGGRTDRYVDGWKHACEKAGITATPHITRHTFATEYIKRGGNLYALCKLCGWSNYRMIEKRYEHLAPDYLEGAVDIMEGVAR